MVPRFDFAGLPMYLWLETFPWVDEWLGRFPGGAAQTRAEPQPKDRSTRRTGPAQRHDLARRVYRARPPVVGSTPGSAEPFAQLNFSGFLRQATAPRAAAAICAPPGACTFRHSEVTPILPCKVSIVIPLFNRVGLTESCWDSIVQHTAQALCWEAVFVDNASTDGTPEFLADLSRKHPRQVTAIRNDENIGFARACNQGALAARGSVIVFLNNDTLVHPGWLPPLVEELDERQGTGVVGGRLLYPDGSIQHAGVVIGRSRIPYHCSLKATQDDPMVTLRRTFRIVTGACMTVRKDEFVSMGMFDEAYLNGHEDVDLCLRYCEAGRKVVYRPECVVTHFESQTEGRFAHCRANTERTLLRWHGKLAQDDFNYQFLESDRATPERPLFIAFKIPAADRRAAPAAATLRAEVLARELCRRGHQCRIDFKDDWGLDDQDRDIVIVIPGKTRYVVKPYSRTVLWPESEATLSRLNAADLEQYQLILPPPQALDNTAAPAALDAVENALLQLAAIPPTTAPAPATGMVSVLMATRNRRELISSAIDSVRAQTVSNWELVVVNDGGESVADVIAAYADPRIKYRDAEHRSKGHAVNTAFAQASGRFIAHLDDDDIWYPEHLERALGALGSLPGVQMTYSDMVETTLVRTGEAWRTARSRPLPAPQATFADLLECNCIPGITVVHTRELFKQAGGMDTSLEVLVDFDLWRRLAMLTDPYHISALTAERFFRQSPGSGQSQITDLNTTNRRRYLWNLCRILRKRLPGHIDAALRQEQNAVRRKVQALFLSAQAEHHARKGNNSRAAASHRLAAQVALNLCRRLMQQLYHADE